MPTQINKNTANAFSFVKNQNIFELINTRISAGVNGSTVIVPHVCNNSNAFGAGFAGKKVAKVDIY